MSARLDGLTLVERDETYGRVRLAYVDHTNGVEVQACALTIDALTMSDGAGGTCIVHGIGNVETLPAYRRRGLATQLMRLAIDHMRDAGADASLLYGIDDFYVPLGWQSCGDERWVRIELNDRSDQLIRSPLDVVREMRADDLPKVMSCYDLLAARTTGAILRPSSSRAWEQLDPTEMRIVERSGAIAGWVWRGRGGVAERDAVAARRPNAVVFAELQAIDQDAMGSVVQAAVEWARTSGEPSGRSELVTGAPEGHALRELARRGDLACVLEDEVRPTGGAMLLPFTDVGRRVAQLELYQFLPDRF